VSLRNNQKGELTQPLNRACESDISKWEATSALENLACRIASLQGPSSISIEIAVDNLTTGYDSA